MSDSPPPEPARLPPVQLNIASRPFQDLYFQLLTSSWTRLSLLAVVVYLVINTLFALSLIHI